MGVCKLDLDGKEHLGLKDYCLSSFHSCCLWNASDLWYVLGLFFLFLLSFFQEFSVKGLMVD